MAFNGSGAYIRPGNSFDTPTSGTTIVSANADAYFADLATALSTCVLKDGTQTITANLPMSNYRHTGVSNATALTQYATADQVSDNALLYGGASAAGTDTYAATLSISPGAYAAGQRYSFKADVANTGACTINFNSIGAASIKLMNGNDPYNNSIVANQVVELIYDGTNFQLLNPMPVFTGATVSTTTASTAVTVANNIQWESALTDTDSITDIGGSNPDRLTIPSWAKYAKINIGISSAGTGASWTVHKNGAIFVGRTYNPQLGVAAYEGYSTAWISVTGGDYFTVNLVAGTGISVLQDSWASIELRG